MNNCVNVAVRDFAVLVRDERTDAESVGHIVLTRQQLQAAALVGMDSKELIRRAYGRQGYKVLDIVKSVKKTLAVDLYSVDGEIVIEGREPVEFRKEGAAGAGE